MNNLEDILRQLQLAINTQNNSNDKFMIDNDNDSISWIDEKGILLSVNEAIAICKVLRVCRDSIKLMNKVL